jgi:hypothetical protein
VIVSFIWGVALLGEAPSSIGLAILGLLLILLGIVGLSVCNSDGVKKLEDRRRGSASVQEQPLLPSDKVINDQAHGVDKKVFWIGLLAAVGCGCRLDIGEKKNMFFCFEEGKKKQWIYVGACEVRSQA